MFRTVPLSTTRSFSLYRQQWYMSYRSADSLLSANLYDIYIWTEELPETCRVLFQKKFEKLVHLVGFIITIYHDARSPERQMTNIMNDI